MWIKSKKIIKSLLPFAVPVVRAIRSFIAVYVFGTMRMLLHTSDKKPRKLIRFEVHIADHCNLNCVGCSHFSPLAKPSFVNIDEFRRDFSRMGELFSHKCEWIHLLGGEPLLNPDIIELMKIARDNFSEGDIQIITNGILLPQQDEKFWRACHENNIQILMTHYPITVDIDRVRSLSDKFGVEFKYFLDETEKNLFSKRPMDLHGKCNARLSFLRCTRGNNCPCLRNGRLFICTMLPNVRFFNEAFGQNIQVTEADYIRYIFYH